MSDAVKVLSKRLKNRNKNRFKAGTVVAWTGGGFYNYAAIFAGDRWYVTGGGVFYGSRPLSTEDFLKVLERADTTNVRVATDWTLIEGTESEPERAPLGDDEWGKY